MANFFDRFRTQPTSSDLATTDTDTGVNSEQPVLLCVNDTTVTINAEQAKGKTIRQLFREFMDDECDADNLNSFIVTGNVRSGNTPASPGMVIRAAVTADSKANRKAA